MPISGQYWADAGSIGPVLARNWHIAFLGGPYCNVAIGLNCSVQVYCTLAGARCGVCDSSDPGQAHPASLAIDGSDRWWQSPSLQYGPAYHAVTLTLDLRKVYQAS